MTAPPAKRKTISRPPAGNLCRSESSSWADADLHSEARRGATRLRRSAYGRALHRPDQVWTLADAVERFVPRRPR